MRTQFEIPSFPIEMFISCGNEYVYSHRKDSDYWLLCNGPFEYILKTTMSYKVQKYILMP